MDSSPELKAYQEVLQSHQFLKALLKEIEEALDRRQHSIAEVSDMLARLGDELIKHFALEEDGGYFAEALVRAPQLVARANDLLAQHPKMSTQVKGVLMQLAPAGPDEQWWRETQRRFLAFQNELLKHERSEDKLLQEAYTQDLGSHD